MDRGAQMDIIARFREYSLEELSATLSLEAAAGLSQEMAASDDSPIEDQTPEAG